MPTPEPVTGLQRPRVRAVVIEDHGGAGPTTVLLLRRSSTEEWYPEHWNLPGGCQEANEGAQEAIARELIEEAGLTAQPTGKAGPWWTAETYGTTFLLKEPSGGLRVEPSEHSEGRWFSPAALPEALMPGTLEAIRQFFPNARTEPALAEALADDWARAFVNQQRDDAGQPRIDAAATLETLRDVSHEDRGEVRQPTKTPEGYLKADAYTSRVGVLTYLLADGTTRRELVHPDHLFDPESLATMAEIPITRLHPDVPGGLLDATTARDHTRGWTGPDPVRDGALVRIPVTITDADLVKDVEDGMRETSGGYRCDLVMQPGVTRGIPGVPDGLAYDAIQTRRRYNHLAVVPRGRAGHEVRIRMDAAQQLPHHDHEENHPMEGTIKLDGVEYKAPIQLAQAIAAVQKADAAKVDAAMAKADTATARADQAEQDAAAEKKKAEEAMTKADAATARADVAEAEAAKLKAAQLDGAQLDAAIAARVDLLDKVKALVPADAKLDGLSPAELKRAAVAAVYPTIALDGKSDDYVNATFDAAVATGPRKDSTVDLAKTAANARRDAAAPDAQGDKVQAATEKARNDSANAWQQPLGVHK